MYKSPTLGGLTNQSHWSCQSFDAQQGSLSQTGTVVVFLSVKNHLCCGRKRAGVSNLPTHTHHLSLSLGRSVYHPAMSLRTPNVATTTPVKRQRSDSSSSLHHHHHQQHDDRPSAEFRPLAVTCTHCRARKISKWVLL